MPRARQLKPEAYSSEQIAAATELGFSLLQTLWIWGDDVGIHPAKPAALARVGIGLWGHGSDEVLRRVALLTAATDSSRNGEPLVYEYEVDGVRFWLIPGFIRQNPSQYKPSSRHPLPLLRPDSPQWLKRWMREYSQFFSKLPPDIRKKFPDVRIEAEAEAEPEAEPETETEGLTNQPSPDYVAGARAEVGEHGSAGDQVPEAEKAPRTKRSPVTQLALERVRDLVGKRRAHVDKALDEDAASAITIRKLGGWDAFEARMKTEPELAATEFCQEFGKTCAAKANSPRGSPRKARAA